MTRAASMVPLASHLVPSITDLVSTKTAYFHTGPRPVIAKFVSFLLAADADFTTGDEDMAVSVDYTVDGTTWVAVQASMGPIDGDQFLQYEPVTLPATITSQKVIADSEAPIDFRIPKNATVRVVCTIAGTSPDFHDPLISVWVIPI